MANRIQELEGDLLRQAEEIRNEALENFQGDAELTPEEQEAIREINGTHQTVVTEVRSNGTAVSTPFDEFAAPLDRDVMTLEKADGSEETIKAVNTGDAKQLAADLRREAQSGVLKAYRELSGGAKDLTDAEILAINDRALEAIQKHFAMEKLSSDAVRRRMSRMSLQQMAMFLPREFMDLYADKNDIRGNNLATRELIVNTIEYLIVSGPEFDVNEYIDHHNRLMVVSREILQAQIDFSEMLKSPEKMSEFAARAASMVPNDNSGWRRRLHHEFAQNVLTYQEYEKAYLKIHQEHEGDSEAQSQVMEEIEECRAKQKIYTEIANLTLFRELAAILFNRYKTDRRMSYRFLRSECVSAIERIRRCPQDVAFPIAISSDEQLRRMAKRPETLLDLYISQFTEFLASYNQAGITAATGDNTKDKVDPDKFECILLPPFDTKIVHEYYAMILLILHGRLVRRLTDNKSGKLEAIELDAYFKIYCKLKTDVYFMNDYWNILKEFVEYAVVHWPKPASR